MAHVPDGRGRSAIDGYFEGPGETTCAGIEQVAMDMWPACITSLKAYTNAAIVHERFHVVAHLNYVPLQRADPRPW